MPSAAEAPAACARPTDVAGGGALLAVDDVSFSYLDRYPGLDQVSLHVDRGEKLALLGANGCGKSTLLKVLDGLVFPDSGTYRAFGAQVTEDNLEDEQFSQGFRSRVGFVFQNSDAQVFSPSVREEIAFGPLNMAMSRDQVVARVDDTMEMLGIADLADRAPYQLSGGQKKRVAIASVLVMNPEVLLFDEPTAALDPRTQQWLMELIVELSRAGKTIVLATHDLDSLEVLADRCAVFSEDHRIVATGATADVLGDRDLLLSVNLIHEHSHLHPTREHVHNPTNDRPRPGPAKSDYAEVTWSVPDVTCAACERTIENAVRPLLGVESVAVDVAAKVVTVLFRRDKADLGAVSQAIEAAGYPVGSPVLAS